MSWLNSQEKLTLVLVEKCILGILFCKKIYCIIAFIAYCNSFLRGQLLHIAIFNSFFSCYCYCYCNSSDGYCQCLGTFYDYLHLSDDEIIFFSIRLYLDETILFEWHYIILIYLILKCKIDRFQLPIEREYWILKANPYGRWIADVYSLCDIKIK